MGSEMCIRDRPGAVQRAQEPDAPGRAGDRTAVRAGGWPGTHTGRIGQRVQCNAGAGAADRSQGPAQAAAPQPCKAPAGLLG